MKNKTPKGNRRDAAIPSGEVFREYGVVDLNSSFHAERYTIDPEPLEAEEEEHVVVPFRVVERGYQDRRSARRAAERWEEEEGGSYKAVQLSDPRGI